MNKFRRLQAYENSLNTMGIPQNIEQN